jgi:hypothetical protein
VAAAQPVALDLSGELKDADVLSSSSTMKGEECDSASSTSEPSDCTGSPEGADTDGESDEQFDEDDLFDDADEEWEPGLLEFDDDENVEGHLMKIYTVTNGLLEELHEQHSAKLQVTQRSAADLAMKDWWQRASEESRRAWLANHPDHPGFDDA